VLMILAVFSIFFGFITKDMFIGLGSGFFSDNALFIHPSHEIMLDTEFGVATLFKLLPLMFTISLSVIAILLSEFLSTTLISFKLSRTGYNIFSFFNQRFLIELFYNRFVTGIVLKLGGQTTRVLDKGSVEYIGPYGLEKGLVNMSSNISNLNTGSVTTYGLFITTGIVLFIYFSNHVGTNMFILSILLVSSLLLFNNNKVSLPLQSSMFSINKRFLVKFVASIIFAAIGYGIKLVVFKYSGYDLFSNLDNWQITLSYICSYAGIRFLINAWLDNSNFMSYAAGSSEVSNLSLDKNVLPKNYNAANNNSAMQNPDNLSSGSTMQDPNNASAGNSSTTNAFSVLEKKIKEKKEMLNYYSDGIDNCDYRFSYIMQERAKHVQNNQWDQVKADKFDSDIQQLNQEKHDWVTNYNSDNRMIDKWETELRNGGHSMAESSSQSSSTKRTTDNSSMSDDYSTSSTKRGRNN